MYWWNSEHKLAVIEIPKNASSSFRENFKDWPSLHNTELWKQQEAEEIIVVFRDPYKRFLSALNQFMSTQHWNDTPDITPQENFPWFYPDFTDNKGRFNVHDVHFLPQLADLHPRTFKKFPERYPFFWMTKDVVLDVQTYLWNKYKITPPRYGRIHVNKGGFKIIKEVDEDLVKNTYKEDYEFFEKLTKEHKWENK